MGSELLIYIDPGFLDKIGHYRNFADNIHEEARKRSIDIWHLVNEDVSEDAAKRYGIERVFKYKAILKDGLYFNNCNSEIRKLAHVIKNAILDRLRVIKRFDLNMIFNYKAILNLVNDLFDNYNERVVKSFSEVTEAIMGRVVESRYDKILIYMYTSHPLYFPIFAKLLNSEKFSQLNIKAYICLFYLNNTFCINGQIPKYEHMLKSVSELLETHDPGQRIRLCSDSQKTIDRYSPYFKRQLQLLPIPIGRGTKSTPNLHERKKTNEKIVIGFFGYTHRKQGYHLTKELYRKIVKTNKYDNVHFVIRHNINFLNSEMTKLVDDFRRESTRIIHLIGDLPVNEYRKYIQNCDIILIPHSKDDYPCQTSGLFTDSLRYAKVVVVPENTWMADMIEEYGSGASFISNDKSSLIKTVKEVCDNFSYYHANATKNIETFSRFHTAESLFDIMEIGQRPRSAQGVT